MTDRIDVGDIIAPVLQLVPGTGRQNDVKGYPPYCLHGQTVLDAEARTVRCEKCGKTLDPFDVLLDYAQGERRWKNWQKEATDAANRVEQLKTEERKVKARTKSHARKDALEAVRLEQLRTERMRLDIVTIARDLGAAAKRIEQLAQRGPRKDPKG